MPPLRSKAPPRAPPSSDSRPCARPGVVMYVCACVRACVCVCMCVWVGGVWGGPGVKKAASAVAPPGQPSGSSICPRGPATPGHTEAGVAGATSGQGRQWPSRLQAQPDRAPHIEGAPRLAQRVDRLLPLLHQLRHERLGCGGGGGGAMAGAQGDPNKHNKTCRPSEPTSRAWVVLKSCPWQQ